MRTRGPSGRMRHRRPPETRRSDITRRFTSLNPFGHARWMFIIELLYKVDLAKIDAAMPAHMAFLKKHYAAGNFLVSGRKIPRDGGIILAVAKSRDQIELIVSEDPFCARGLAEFRIIEFRASQRADDIQKRIDGAARA